MLSSAVLLIPARRCLVLLPSSIPAFPYSFNPSRIVCCSLCNVANLSKSQHLPSPLYVTLINLCSAVAAMLPMLLGPKVMVLENHVCFPSISGSCMRLDISPTLMLTCQFSKLVKKHLVICHKSGMFDDGATCLCNSVRGSLYHLFQWVIPVSFFPFLGPYSYLVEHFCFS